MSCLQLGSENKPCWWAFLFFGEKKRTLKTWGFLCCLFWSHLEQTSLSLQSLWYSQDILQGEHNSLYFFWRFAILYTFWKEIQKVIVKWSLRISKSMFWQFFQHMETVKQGIWFILKWNTKTLSRKGYRKTSVLFCGNHVLLFWLLFPIASLKTVPQFSGFRIEKLFPSLRPFWE